MSLSSGGVFNDHMYDQLKEKIVSSSGDISQYRRLMMIILHQLQPFLESILKIDGMERFEQLKHFNDYIASHIDDLESNKLKKYIVLCDETGVIVGEGEASSLFSDEEIIDMREKYYASVETRSGREKIISDYAFSIFEALYYLLCFFEFDGTEEGSITDRVIDLCEYVFEEWLVDLNEELFELEGVSFLNTIISLMLNE